MDGWKAAAGLAFAAALALVVSVSNCSTPEDEPDAGDGGPPRVCEHDSFDGPDSAGELETSETGDGFAAGGFVCPIEDRDWYHLSVPTGDHLLRVTLGVHGPGSPVQPTYAVYECDSACVADPPEDGPATCCEARVAPLPAEVGLAVSSGLPLEVTHCIEPGDYFIVVRDQGDDNQDGVRPRGEYDLTVTTAPDPDVAEPNDGPESAVGLTADGSRQWTASGQISCRGDQDWYVLDDTTGIVVGDTDLLEVQLTVPISDFHPQYRIIGPEEVNVATVSNAAGDHEATDLGGLYWLESGGRYYIVVEDDDGGQADPGATYDLTVRLVSDPDTNEPNNEPSQATLLGNLSCGGSWAEATRTAGIAATNDVDVYRVNLDPSCRGGVLEASATFGGGRPEGLQPAIRIMRNHPETPCVEHHDCRRLLVECNPNPDPEEDDPPAGIDCSGLGNSCLTDGVCAGAAWCLPGGTCGANIISRQPDYCGSDGHCHGPSGAMANRECETNSECADQGAIATAIPLGRNPDGVTITHLDHVYVVVQDFGADMSDPAATYTLRVRVRQDPDANEPNEHYSHVVTSEIGPERLDTVPTLAWGGCAVGYLSYERDYDYFRIPHPCLASADGCTLRITYNVGAGPVEVVARASPYDNLARIEPDVDVASNPSSSGTYGGAGECLPASSHVRDTLTVEVRDLDYNRDFSADQRYEICFNVQSPTCAAPCAPGYDGQCWYPE